MLKEYSSIILIYLSHMWYSNTVIFDTFPCTWKRKENVFALNLLTKAVVRASIRTLEQYSKKQLGFTSVMQHQMKTEVFVCFHVYVHNLTTSSSTWKTNPIWTNSTDLKLHLQIPLTEKWVKVFFQTRFFHSILNFAHTVSYKCKCRLGWKLREYSFKLHEVWWGSGC